MKLISFIVPCYNSEGYMEKCIESLLHFPERTEIIIVDDGSTDGTARIADEYALKYPSFVKVIHQENRGHGGAINAGLAVASGLYIRTVDSDDWLDSSSLKTVLDRLEDIEPEGGVDLLVTNYSYYRKEKGLDQTITYKAFFKPDTVVTWNDVSVRKIRPWHQFMVHALTFRTEIIRNSKMVLPENVYYEDNYVICYLFPFCEKILYLDTNLYVYYIGREGQSMSWEMLEKCGADARKVTEMCWNLNDLDEIKKKNKKLHYVLLHELWLLVSSAILFSRIPRSKEADDSMRRFCDRLKAGNKKYYNRLMHRNFFSLLKIPGRIGRFFSLDVMLKIAHDVVGFN